MTSLAKTDALDALKKRFQGWHYCSSDAFNSKTVSAYACNDLKTAISDHYSSKLHNTAEDVTSPKQYANALLLRPDGNMVLDQFHKKFQLLRPATVYVTGPTETAVATLCTVPTLFVETAFFDIIKAKATSHVFQVYKRWKESSEYEFDGDFKVAKNSVAAKAKAGKVSEADWHSGSGEYLLDTDLADKVAANNSKNYATSVANVYLAMRVQHICDIDSGGVFRDKHGRDAASMELNAATETLLYYTYSL